MISFNDNDFVRVWDWIGKILLQTLLEKNFCGEQMLEESEDIEKFIHSLIPTAIEFSSKRVSKFKKNCRYVDVSKEEIERLTKHLENPHFKYNFDETDDDYIFGGSETLIIDLEKKISYIH